MFVNSELVNIRDLLQCELGRLGEFDKGRSISLQKI